MAKDMNDNDLEVGDVVYLPIRITKVREVSPGYSNLDADVERNTVGEAAYTTKIVAVNSKDVIRRP